MDSVQLQGPYTPPTLLATKLPLSPVTMADGYALPPIAQTYLPLQPVTLEEGYPAPLSATVMPCDSGVQYVDGELAATIPAPALDLTLSANGETLEPDFVAGSLEAALPPPALYLNADITGESSHPNAPPLRIPVVLESPYSKAILAATILDNEGDEYPPLLSVPITLIPGYTAPPLSERVVVYPVGGAPVTHDGEMAATLPTPATWGLSALATVDQILDLPDNDGASIRSTHRRVYPDEVLGLALQQRHGKAISLPVLMAQQAMDRRQVSLTAPQTQMILFQRPMGQKHQHGLNLSTYLRAGHDDAIRSRSGTRERHQHGLALQGTAGLPHTDTIKRRPSVRLAEQQAQPVGRSLGIGNKQAWPTGTRLEARWTKADHPAPGYWWPVYQPPGLRFAMPCEGDYQPRPLHCDVILGPGYEPQPPCEIDPEPPHDTIIIPIREIYTVINTLTLTELDGTPVPAEDFSASIDADSWTWSWNTRIPADALAQVRPDSSTRVELIATINGEPLRVLVENIQRERRFGESWLRVSGRGRAAFLADPLAPVTQYTNTSAMTAQQALNATLTANGVPIGWTIDWQIEDWQIPSGIWSHNGTWIDAAKRIAEAGGAYVQSHDTDQILRILPKYPAAPWDWSAATPDIQLPEDVVEVEGIEWQEKPDYNAVWVHGGDQGRADRIIIGSTGGTNPAPTIVDELATDPAMTRQRGLALLGDTGKQAQISLRLPVLPESGMIRPGTMVEYLEQGNTRRGLVRSLSISHSRPELWQTIGVETHE